MEHITFFQSIPPATEKKKKKNFFPQGERGVWDMVGNSSSYISSILLLW